MKLSHMIFALVATLSAFACGSPTQEDTKSVVAGVSSSALLTQNLARHVGATASATVDGSPTTVYYFSGSPALCGAVLVGGEFCSTTALPSGAYATQHILVDSVDGGPNYCRCY